MSTIGSIPSATPPSGTSAAAIPRPASPEHYRSHQDFRPGRRVPAIRDGRQIGEIAVEDLLP